MVDRRLGRALWLAIGLATLSWPVSSSAQLQAEYEVIALGLTDPEHTRDDGYQSSEAVILTNSGYVGGISRQYQGTDTGSPGLSAWIFDSSTRTTTRLGLTDPLHTRADGHQFTYAPLVAESGYASGNSKRFDGGSVLAGESAWIYDPTSGATTRLGYTDALHTRSDGAQWSAGVALTESGYVAGFSYRYGGGDADLGRSSWLYDATSGTTTPLGFTDLAHTRNDGYQYSFSRVYDSGYAIGSSWRYNGNAGNILANSPFIYDVRSGTTTSLGLTDELHTHRDGYQYGGATYDPKSGLVLGQSFQANGGSTWNGISAWVYEPSTNQTTGPLGLTDAAHTRSDGYQESGVRFATASGYAAGYSARYEGGSRSAWFYDKSTGTTTELALIDREGPTYDYFSDLSALTESGYATGNSYWSTELGSPRSTNWLYSAPAGTTVQVGLAGAMYTRDDGLQGSNAYLLSESGYVAGVSYRYDGVATPLFGANAWVYDPASALTTVVGLTDAMHTRSDGYQNGAPTHVTDSGLVAGFAERWDGLGSRTAWIYDASSGEQVSIMLSPTSSRSVYSSVSVLTEEGLALGFHRYFDVAQNQNFEFAFAWTSEDGLVDLGSLVAGDLTDAGWRALTSAIQTNGLDQIIGRGRLASGGDLAYLLAPIPEPGTLPMLALGLAGLARTRIRRA